MGAAIAHNTDDEPVVLRDALVLVWDALEPPRTEEEICAQLAGPMVDLDLAPRVREAIVALEAVGLATRCP